MRLALGIMALVAISLAMAVVSAEEAGTVDEGGIDPAAPILTMTATTTEAVLDNSGTAQIDVRGLKIVNQRNEVVGTVPETQSAILQGNPFTFTRGVSQPMNYRIIVPVAGVAPGDVLRLTNGIGTYAKCEV